VRSDGGEAAGVLVVDDYAHNPTKVAAVLRAARDGWPRRRVIALFQPHRFSRTRTTHAEFGGAFGAADEVVVTEIYAANENPQPGVSAQLIVDAIAKHRPVHFRTTAHEALDLLETLVAPGDIVLTLREKRTDSRRQNIAVQVARAQAVTLQNIPSGKGLGELGISRRPLPAPPKPKAVAHDDHGHGGHH
jgi:UDP-N-acetylmuramate--alanine ligase